MGWCDLKLVKKYKMISMVLLILLVILTVIPNIVEADTILDPDQFFPHPNSNTSEILNKANVIIGIIQAIGSIVSVVTLIIMGIRYMMGSVEEKAEYKKSMIPYLLGAIFLFAGSNILSIFYNYFKTLKTTI